MRICLNLLAATAAGHLTRARAFLERFKRYSGDAELVVLKVQGILTECTSANGYTVVDVPIGLGRFKAVRRMAWENCFMPKLLRANGIDVYLTFHHYLPAALPRSLPSVVGISNLAPFSDNAWDVESLPVRLKMTLLKRSIIAAARGATSVIAISKTCKDVLISHGITPSKISVIPNGVDAFWSQQSAGDEVLNEYGIAASYVLYVSHFYRYKNHLRLLHAFAKLPASTRAAHQLVLVGKPYDQRYFDEVLALRSQLGLADDVIVIRGEGGERLRELYQRAGLFVFPSLIENCPNILLEAMAAGVPVVASRLQPMPEFGGSAVEYFDPLDPGDMALKISMVLDSNTVLEKLKEDGVRQVRQFSWDVFVRDVLQQCRIVDK